MLRSVENDGSEDRGTARGACTKDACTGTGLTVLSYAHKYRHFRHAHLGSYCCEVQCVQHLGGEQASIEADGCGAAGLHPTPLLHADENPTGHLTAETEWREVVEMVR